TSWSTQVPIHEDGIGFLPRVAADGTLYLGYTEFPGFVFEVGVMLQRSLDGGVTVAPPERVVNRLDIWDVTDNSRFPGRFRVPALPILAVDPGDGTLYFVYMDTTSMHGGDSDVDVYLVSSTDGGATWTAPVIVAGGPAVGGDQFMPWLEVDDEGGLHMIFFDSRHTPQADDVFDARLDVYYSTSDDGGASWTEYRLTEAPFSTAGIDWPGQGQFLGDYLGLTVGDRQLWVSYPRVDDTGSDLDIFVRRIRLAAVFDDGFESGGTTAWTSAIP
ncbi:MAG: glycoside hydrolase, partial [Holophagales bacterium]|nr:glycoside hydrolase [Holophagales bacterium]